MRSVFARVQISLLLGVLLFPLLAAAQESPTPIKFQVPFRFIVGAKELPAGNYSIVETAQHVVVLRNARSQTVATVITNSVEFLVPRDSTKVVFQFEGGHYFLAQVWTEHSQIGDELTSALKPKHGDTVEALAATPQP